MNKLLKKRAAAKFDLDDDERAVVEELKKDLIEPPIFALLNTDQLFTIEADAFDKQFGCPILQPQNDEKDLRPVGYRSRSFNDAEQPFDNT